MDDDYYKTRYTFDPNRRVVWIEIVRYLMPFIPEDSVVLDLGAGYCDFINNIKAKKKYALDISKNLPRFAASDVIAMVSSSTDMKDIGADTVDIVHASNYLEHLDDEDLLKTMGEIKRVMKKRGYLILIQPNFRYTAEKYFDDKTHKKIFDDDSLKSFLKAHDFDIVFKKSKFLPFSMNSKPSFMPLTRLMVRAYIHSPFKPFAGQMLIVGRKNV